MCSPINIVFFTRIKSFHSLHVESLRTLCNLQDEFICVIDHADVWWIRTVPSDVIDATSRGKSLSTYDDRAVLNEYRRNRYLMIGKTLQKGYAILGDEYSYAFVRQTLERKIDKGNFVKRRLESFDITKLGKAIIAVSEIDRESTRHKKQAISQIIVTKLSSDTKKYSTDKSCEPISPRAEHSTKKVEESRSEIIAFPLPKASHEIGLRRGYDEITQLSIPETDSGAYSSSFASSAVPKYKSILINKNATVRNPDSRNNTVTNQHSCLVTRPQQWHIGSSVRDNARVTQTSNNLPQYNGVRQQNTGSAPNANNATLTKPPRHPDYADRNNRFMSFGTHGWPLSGKPDTATLVNWGFFATGTHDLVRCFQCGIGLKDWNDDDDVMTEHVKHSNECPFLLEQLGQDQLLRLKRAILYPDLDFDNSNAGTVSNRQTTQSTAVRLPYPIRHPRYQTMESRVASFRNFPANVTQPHQQLAIAGFFFTGKNDIVRCFTCDGGLQRWTPGDDAIIEHAKYFPTCSYIRQLKGDEFVQSVQTAMNSNENENSTSQPQTTAGANGIALNVNHEESNSYQMDRLSLNAGAAADKSTQSKDRLRTPEVRSILDMGYAKDVVQKAIQELEKQGKKNCNTDEIMNEILDNETRWNNTSSYENSSENNTVDQSVIEAENKRLKTLIRCMLCLTGETDILCLPCTHHRMCHECAKDVTHCPVCAKRIQDKIRTYMA